MQTDILEPIPPQRPRWAKDIADDRWDRLPKLVIQGRSTREILRELDLPETKTRSLQVFARKVCARRRVAQFDSFKDALTDALAAAAPNLTTAVRNMVMLAADPGVEVNVQIRAFEAISRLTRSVTTMMKKDVESELNPINDKDDQDPVDQWEVISESTRRVYGLDMDNPPKQNPFNSRDPQAGSAVPIDHQYRDREGVSLNIHNASPDSTGEPRASARADVQAPANDPQTVESATRTVEQYHDRKEASTQADNFPTSATFHPPADFVYHSSAPEQPRQHPISPGVKSESPGDEHSAEEHAHVQDFRSGSNIKDPRMDRHGITQPPDHDRLRAEDSTGHHAERRDDFR